jgi:tetratricopeptide (TPR) repeat protein
MLLTNASVVSYISERSDAIDQFMRDKKYLEAKQKVIQVLWVNPYDGRANRQSREIDRQLQRLADDLYKQAQSQFDSGDYAACIASLEKALTYRQDFQQARKLLEDANKEYADIALLNQARTSYQNGSFMTALNAVNKLLRTDPRNAEAKTLKDKILAALRSNLNTYLGNGIEFYNNGEYEKAIAEFDKVLAVEPYNGVATDYRTKAVSKLEAIRRYRDTGN